MAARRTRGGHDKDGRTLTQMSFDFGRWVALHSRRRCSSISKMLLITLSTRTHFTSRLLARSGAAFRCLSICQAMPDGDVRSRPKKKYKRHFKERSEACLEQCSTIFNEDCKRFSTVPMSTFLSDFRPARESLTLLTIPVAGVVISHVGSIARRLCSLYL